MVFVNMFLLRLLEDGVLKNVADRVLYTPERLSKIAAECAKEDSVFTLNDRLGLVHDSMALAKAGFATLSSAMNLVNILRREKECQFYLILLRFETFTTHHHISDLVWDGISQNLSELVSIWWEESRVTDLLNALCRV